MAKRENSKAGYGGRVAQMSDEPSHYPHGGDESAVELAANMKPSADVQQLLGLTSDGSFDVRDNMPRPGEGLLCVVRLRAERGTGFNGNNQLVLELANVERTHERYTWGIRLPERGKPIHPKSNYAQFLVATQSKTPQDLARAVFRATYAPGGFGNKIKVSAFGAATPEETARGRAAAEAIRQAEPF